MVVVTVSAFATVQISEGISFNNLSKFDQMVAVMNKTVEDDEIFNYVLVNYKYLQDGIKISQQSSDYVADLIIQGYNAEDVIDCTYFWLDTNEEVSIIQEMCSWKAENEEYSNNQFWIEEAFNSLTNNKSGVLTMEDFEEYSQQGITDEIIMIANRLCRKGVYTIQEILEKYENGILMTDIAIEIENQVSCIENKNSKLMLASSNDEYPKVKDNEIFQSKELATLNNTPEQAFYDVTDETTDIATELEKASGEVMSEITAELREGNYMRIPRRDVAENE